MGVWIGKLLGTTQGGIGYDPLQEQLPKYLGGECKPAQKIREVFPGKDSRRDSSCSKEFTIQVHCYYMNNKASGRSPTPVRGYCQPLIGNTQPPASAVLNPTATPHRHEVCYKRDHWPMRSMDQGKIGVLCPKIFNLTLAIDAGPAEWRTRQTDTWGSEVSSINGDTSSLFRKCCMSPGAHSVHFSLVTVSLDASHPSRIPCLINLHVERNPRREGKGWQLPGSLRSGCLTPKLLEGWYTHRYSLSVASKVSWLLQLLLLTRKEAESRKKRKGLDYRFIVSEKWANEQAPSPGECNININIRHSSEFIYADSWCSG